MQIVQYTKYVGMYAILDIFLYFLGNYNIKASEIGPVWNVIKALHAISLLFCPGLL